MRKEMHAPPFADEPCLVVTYGNTSRKHRSLDADLIILGKHPSCDFNLVSPEVAPVHCVIAKVADGWRLRDCSGRNGTRVNGKLVHDTILSDGDVIQVGSFSFEAKLPGFGSKHDEKTPAISPALFARLQGKRRKMVELALRLRKRVGNRRMAVTDSETHLIALRAELNQQAALLQARQKDYDLRVTRVELSERDLATDRATLDKEFRAFQEDVERHSANVRAFNEHVERMERELQQKRETLQEEIRKLREETEKRAATRTANAVPDEEHQRTRQKTRELEARARELDQYARHLRKLCQKTGTPVPDLAAQSLTSILQVHQDTLTEIAGGLRAQLAQATAVVDQLRATMEHARAAENGSSRDSAVRRRPVTKAPSAKH